MSKLISIGKVLGFHGIKGEIKMGFTSGKEGLIKRLKSVFLFVNGVKEQFDIQSVRFHKNFAIVKLEQVNSIDDVMNIKGLLVHVTEEMLKSSLEKDEFLINDLVNISVFDTGGNKIGKVSAVGDNNASNLLEIEKTNGLKFMVPFVKEWVPVVDTATPKIVIKYSDGIDLTGKTGSENDEV